MVDEAAAYDALAILYVKQERLRNGKEKLFTEVDRMLACLIHQLGDTTHVKVLNSKEFQALYESNRTIFDLVDKAARDEVPASAVVEANNLRHKFKKEFQERHFQRPLTEIKG